MSAIALVEGDFGSSVAGHFGEEELLLPDPERPGLSQLVPLGAVAEIEAIADDHSGRMKEAGRLAMRGIGMLGPLGLAVGMLGIAKPKDVKFVVRLADGRRFTATAGAAAYAELRANFVRARGAAAPGNPEADRMIAKYIAEQKEAALALLPDPPAAQPAAPAPADPPTASTPAWRPVETHRFGGAAARPAFGRRGR